MTRLHTIGKIEIRVSGRDHLPAHFHVEQVGEFEALIEIETLAIYASTGKIPGRTL